MSTRRVKASSGGGDDGEYKASGSGQKRVIEKGESAAAGDAVPPIVAAQQFMGRLKILQYEIKFCKPKNLSPVTYLSFVVPSSNSLEQFGFFAVLCHWLCGLCGHSYTEPSVYDDPNVSTTNLLEELRKLNAFPVDYAPQKVKQGWGDAPCAILQQLTDLAFKKSQFRFRAPVQPPEAQAEAEMDDIDDDANDTVLGGDDDDDGIADLAIEDDDMDDDEELFGGAAMVGGLKSADGHDDGKPATSMLESKINPAQWKLELERVAPQLKVVVKSDMREWRNRLESLRNYLTVVETSFPENKANLGKIATEVRQALDKIESREKYYNQQLENLIVSYREAQENLTGVNEKFKVESEKVSRATNELADITDDLEMVKGQMDVRGSSITDSAPLMKIKQALQDLKAETRQMDIRIGVVQQHLLRSRLKSGPALRA